MRISSVQAALCINLLSAKNLIIECHLTLFTTRLQYSYFWNTQQVSWEYEKQISLSTTFLKGRSPLFVALLRGENPISVAVPSACIYIPSEYKTQLYFRQYFLNQKVRYVDWKIWYWAFEKYGIEPQTMWLLLHGLNEFNI